LPEIIARSTLHAVDVVDRDRAAIAIESNENGEADGRLRRRDGQDEQREDLPREIAELSGEGDEIEVHRQQDQLDRHQDDDDVLAVEDDSRDAQREEDRRDNEIMREAGWSSWAASLTTPAREGTFLQLDHVLGGPRILFFDLLALDVWTMPQRQHDRADHRVSSTSAETWKKITYFV